MHGVLGFVALLFLFLLAVAMNKLHYEQTGVPMPSRSAMRAVRRRGRKKGLNEQQAYAQWLARKQAKLARQGRSVAPTQIASASSAQTSAAGRHSAKRRSSSKWLWIIPAGIGGVVAAMLFAYQQSSPIGAAPMHARPVPHTSVANVPLPMARPTRPRVSAPLDLRPPDLR